MLRDPEHPTEDELEKLSEKEIECSECFSTMQFSCHHAVGLCTLFRCECGAKAEVSWFEEDL